MTISDALPQICLLYLVLRALDTVEDDVSIPDEKKHPILKDFHTYSVTPGWTFDAAGKGRQILLEYNNIVDEINLMSPAYAVTPLPVNFKCLTFYRQLQIHHSRRVSPNGKWYG